MKQRVFAEVHTASTINSNKGCIETSDLNKDNNNTQEVSTTSFNTTLVTVYQEYRDIGPTPEQCFNTTLVTVYL